MAFLLAALVIAKAVLIPITHDESGQILFYAQQSVKDIFLYTNPWPTNHILNSLAIKLSSLLFGINQMSGRLPNIFSFLLLLLVLLGWAKSIGLKKWYESLFFLSIFLLNPYLFDFFSLARGYGMAISFQLAGFYFLYNFIKTEKSKFIILTEVAALLMVAANFSWLVYWAALQLVLFVLIFNKAKKLLLIQFLFISLTALFCYNPVSRMQATNQFQYWGGEGWINTCFKPLWHAYLYGVRYGDLVYITALVLLLGSFLYFLMNLLKTRKEAFSGNVFMWLFGSTIAVNLAQHFLLHTPYLSGRTALLYYPLISALAFFPIINQSENFKKIVIGIVTSFLIIHFASTYNLKYVREWGYDQYTFQVLDKLKAENPNGLVKLNTHWMFNPSFNFYKQTEKLDWLKLADYHKEEQYAADYEYYYTLKPEDDSAAQFGYKLIWEKDNFNCLLQKTK